MKSFSIERSLPPTAMVAMSCLLLLHTAQGVDAAVQNASRDLLPTLAKLQLPEPKPASVDSHFICTPELGKNCRIIAKSSDRRQSFIMAPGDEVRISLEANSGDEIRFALDRPRNRSNPLQLEVTLEHPDGTFTRNFRTPTPKKPWTEITVPIRHAGQQVLMFRVNQPTKSLDFDALAIAAPRLVMRSATAETPPPNILLYLMDTLRADHTSALGYHRDTTPNLAALAEEGWNFTQATSTAPRTRSSTASILTSLYPSQNHAVLNSGLDLEVESLAEILRRGGWSTYAYVANGNVFEPAFRFDQGFDRFVTIRGKNLDNHAHTIEIHEKIFPNLDRLKGERFFLYVHAVDPHSPYDPPEESRHRYTDPDYRGSIEPMKTVARELKKTSLSTEDFDFVVGLYDEDIRYQDASFGRLLDAMREKNLLENTLIVVVSDHGDEFLEHGGWEHGMRLFEHQLRVPFVVHGPGIEAHTIDTPTSLVDVMPTILAQAGLPGPPQSEGRNAAPLATEQTGNSRSPVFAEEIKPDFRMQSLRQGPWKIIRRVTRAPGGFMEENATYALYRLDNDPSEQNDLALTQTAKLADMRQQLGELRARLATQASAPADAPQELVIDERTRRQLEALGYILDETAGK
jgi:arylsulfatase A-like enzyme